MGIHGFWIDRNGYRCAPPIFKGWILESKQEPGHFLGTAGFNWRSSSFKISRVKAVRKAIAFFTRKLARKVKTLDMVVRRVELFENGKVKRIISGR